MKILLAAVNAKYIHSNLAVYNLKAYAETYLRNCQESDIPVQAGSHIELAEYTINQPVERILMDIYRRKPDVLCLSCYIWNLEYVEAIAREMGKLKPDMPLWLGGPEVSYDAADVLERLPSVTGVMKGEGEETFAGLCRIYWDICEDRTFCEDGNPCEDGAPCEEADYRKYTRELVAIDEKLAELEGITYRDAGGIVRENPWRQAMELSQVPFVYGTREGDFQNRIIYYESSRGCPFSCSYCLSSVDKKLRFRNLDMVKRELQFFIDQGTPQVKFVDRTFNCRHEHAVSIWKYIAEHDRGITNFHFEVAADILNEEELKILEGMRPGLVQLEIGVQSTNPATLRAIRRTMDFDRVRDVVKRIKKGGNIHQHLDLIAGLPYEDMERFARSFDDVYELGPEQLQLGFLKVLKGSYMEERKEEYNLVYQGRPPYEVLYTRWMSYEDMIRLKGIEEMVEVYYNSGQFKHTLDALARRCKSAFLMYDDMYRFYEEHGYDQLQHKRSARYEILLGYIVSRYPEAAEEFRELLVYDYYLRENAKSRPGFAGEYKVSKDVLRAFYEKEEEEHRYLPAYEGYDRNQMRRMTHLEYFARSGKYVLFDYKERDTLNQNARTLKLLLFTP